MADDEIVEKLRKYTHSYPEDEASVVYVMVQAGKIIERNGWWGEFPVLRFYRNWVAHPQLDQRGRGRDGRTEMLDKLNGAIAAFIAKDTNAMEQFESAISLKRLQKEFAAFIQKHQLERPNFDYGLWLEKFDALLVNVLVDLPLIPPPDAGYLFTEFRFKRSSDEASDAEFEIQVSKEANAGKPLTIGGRLRAESKRRK